MNNQNCPICGGHDFSPLAAGQYMCTQCGYVLTVGQSISSASSEKTTTSDKYSSTSPSLDAPPVSGAPNPADGMPWNECPECGNVVDKTESHCPNCGFRLTPVENVEAQYAEENLEDEECDEEEEQLEDEEGNAEYEEEKPKHGCLYKILKWCGIFFGISLVIGALGEFFSGNSTEKGEAVDSAVVDTATVDTVAIVWEQVTFDGDMYDAEGNFGNIRVSYETDGTNVRNCVYKNVDLGGNIKMNLDITDDTYSFSGKDGKNNFSFNISKDKLYGEGHDGNKELLVFLYKEGDKPSAPKYGAKFELLGNGGQINGFISMKGRAGTYTDGDNITWILRLVDYQPGESMEIEAYHGGMFMGAFKGNYDSSEMIFAGTFYHADGSSDPFEMNAEYGD